MRRGTAATRCRRSTPGQIPYTTCHYVTEQHCRYETLAQSAHYVTEQHVRYVPYTTCHYVTEQHCRYEARRNCYTVTEVTSGTCRTRPATWCRNSTAATNAAVLHTVTEQHVMQVPYTTCQMVTEQHCRYIPMQRCYYVPEQHTRTIPYTTCHMISEQHVEMIPCQRTKYRATETATGRCRTRSAAWCRRSARNTCRGRACHMEAYCEKYRRPAMVPYCEAVCLREAGPARRRARLTRRRGTNGWPAS